MSREQKTSKDGYSCKGMVETESNRRARSNTSLGDAERNGAGGLLERILQRDNLNAAYRRVKQNGGASGIDDNER
ncbi:hypothetical protein FACS1894187_23360 [Synergistales bacterium]|nr:hypothetical protein FACS1894187_23360 [Synergistales bacterium]